jgi:hypothetical protein
MIAGSPTNRIFHPLSSLRSAGTPPRRRVDEHDLAAGRPPRRLHDLRRLRRLADRRRRRAEPLGALGRRRAAEDEAGEEPPDGEQAGDDDHEGGEPSAFVAAVADPLTPRGALLGCEPSRWHSPPAFGVCRGVYTSAEPNKAPKPGRLWP